MSTADPEDPASRRRVGRRREARRAGRDESVAVPAPAWIERRLPPYELLDDAALDVIERHADWILSDIGLEIRGDPIALELFAEAGARVVGERVAFFVRESS